METEITGSEEAFSTDHRKMLDKIGRGFFGDIWYSEPYIEEKSSVFKQHEELMVEMILLAMQDIRKNNKEKEYAKEWIDHPRYDDYTGFGYIADHFGFSANFLGKKIYEMIEKNPKGKKERHLNMTNMKVSGYENNRPNAKYRGVKTGVVYDKIDYGGGKILKVHKGIGNDKVEENI